MDSNNINITLNNTGSSPDVLVPKYYEGITKVYKYNPSLVVTLLTVNIVEIVWTILGNLIVILTVVAFRELLVPSNTLVASLAVADFTIGLMLQTSNAWGLLSTLLQGEKHCGSQCFTFLRTMAFVTITVSLAHLSLITLDRFAAIVYPLRYVTIIRMSRTKKAVVFAWTTSFVFGFLVAIPSPVSDGARVLWNVFILLTCLFMITLYGKLYCISRKHAKKIQHEFNSVTPGAETKEERRGLKTFGIVTMAMVISYIPSVIMEVNENVASPDRGETGKLVHDIMRQFTTILALFNSALNPLVYFFRSEKLRTYSYKLLKSIPRRIQERI